MKEPFSLKSGRRQNFLFAIGTDIRSARGMPPLRRLGWNSLRIVLLILSDALALGLAWQLARFLNRFYSPIPEPLDWKSVV